MKEKSLSSQPFIYNHITVWNLKPETVPVDNDLLKSVKSSKMRYNKYIRSQKLERALYEKKKTMGSYSGKPTFWLSIARSVVQIRPVRH